MFEILKFLIVFSLLNFGLCYDIVQLTNGVWLSGAAYCGRDLYKTMKLSGPVSDLVYKNTLYDIKTDIQGFVGIVPSTKSVNVVLRGSSSKMNWLDDFEVRLVNYDTFPECNCKVHNGFYKSALAIRNDTINYVKLQMKLNPTYKVYINGHSYGASVGQLLGLELVKEGIPVHIYDYGQPRAGDKQFASFSNLKINDYWRVTHNKDMVPHVPPIDVFGYYHSCGEIFEDANNILYTCSLTNCEDPKCADQYALYKTNTEDHSYYLGHRVSCEESTVQN